MFEALAEAGINIQMITTSEIKISVLVDRAVGRRGRSAAVHRAFELDEPADDLPRPPSSLELVGHPRLAPARRPTAERPSRRGRRPGMEDLVISGVELDEDQARITLFDVPDQPGYAARVFRRSPRPASSST